MDEFVYYSDKFDATVTMSEGQVVSVELWKPLSMSKLDTLLYETRKAYKVYCKTL